VGCLLTKSKDTGTTSRQLQAGSGRPRTARTLENVDVVDDMICSQEDAPGTHRTVRQISRETGIPKSSVVRIIHSDLQLKCLKKKRAQELMAANRLNRVQRSQLLLDKFSEHEVGFIFFTDEKLLTVAPPMNSQNDRVYAPVATKKRDVSAIAVSYARVPLSSSL